MTSSTCFLTPSLPLSVRASRPAVSSRNAPVTMSLRFPGGNRRNPFNFGSSRPGFGANSGFGSGSGPGSGFGSGGSGKGRGDSEAGGGASDDSNIFKSLWHSYNKCLEKTPIATKAVTSLIGFLLGDLLAQKFLGDKEADLDYGRLARMATFGLLLHGPTGHYFYGALDRLIVGTGPLQVAAKVAVDQLCWAPIFTVMFFTYLGAVERKKVKDIKEKIQNDTWDGVTASWKFWPIAHAINFAFVPTSQRLLYINTLQVGYNVILSIIGNK